MTELFRASSVGNCLRWLFNPQALQFQEDRDGAFAESYYLRRKSLNESFRAEKDRAIAGRRIPSTESTSDSQYADNHYDGAPKNPYLVTFTKPYDPENPQDWSHTKKIFVTLEICLLTTSTYMAASLWSSSVDGAVETLGVSEIVANLGTSFFLFGLAIGPIIFSPVSEFPSIGKNKVYMPTLCLYVVLQLPIVLSDNIAVILVFRFVTGVLASPTQAQGGGSVSDMWRSQKLGYPMMIYDHGKYCRRTNSVQPHSANISLAAAMGTFFGPVVGNFAAEYRDYTWPIWISIWFSGFSLIVLLFLLPETSPDHILYQKARRLRETTANNKFTTQAEQDSQNTTTKDIVRKVFIKPLALNFQGPIVLVLNLYLALIYALLFAALESYKLIFVGIYGFSSGEESLTFIAVLLSFQFGVALYFLFLYYYQEKKFTADGKLPPEQRLIPSFVTAFTVPIGLFWYGWSARTSIHWIMPVIGGSFVGISAAGIFSSILSYLPEAYPSVASTVLAGNCFMRSSIAGLFPIFIPSLYKAIGPGWASSIWAFVGCIFLPAPFVLYRYGSVIRGKSKNARKDF